MILIVWNSDDASSIVAAFVVDVEGAAVSRTTATALASPRIVHVSERHQLPSIPRRLALCPSVEQLTVQRSAAQPASANRQPTIHSFPSPTAPRLYPHSHYLPPPTAPFSLFEQAASANGPASRTHHAHRRRCIERDGQPPSEMLQLPNDRAAELEKEHVDPWQDRV